MHNEFSISAALRFGWATFKEHIALMLPIMASLGVLYAVNTYFSVVSKNDPLVGVYLFPILILFLVLGVGIYSVMLRLVRGEPAHYRDMIPQTKVMMQYIGINLLLLLCAVGLAFFLAALGAMLFVLVGKMGIFAPEMLDVSVAKFALAAIALSVVGACGVLILVIGVVYLMLRYSFVLLAAVDGRGIRNSFRVSAALTRGLELQILYFWILASAINFIGMLCLGVGVLVTGQVTMLAWVHIYDKLLSRAG